MEDEKKLPENFNPGDGRSRDPKPESRDTLKPKR